jgi:hypothetical protein
VVDHPAVFVTLTAPSFGIVHTRRLRRDRRPLRCRPRRDAEVCPHGVRLSCGAIHDEKDPCLGEPICAECFDYEAAVAWNNALSELWRRTTIYLPRVLARLSGRTQKRLGELVRVSYVKVAGIAALRGSSRWVGYSVECIGDVARPRRRLAGGRLAADGTQDTRVPAGRGVDHAPPLHPHAPWRA